MSFNTAIITDYSIHFRKILNFIGIYQKLIDCHLVDFITQRLWDECLPEKLKSELDTIDTDEDIWISENHVNSELSNFIQLTKSFSLESCPAVLHVDDLPELLPRSIKKESVKHELNPSKTMFMHAKKSYEIEIFGKIIADMALSTHSLVIDAGAGKAYLSTYLSEHYDIPVLAIDSSQTCHKSAINRQKKIQKRKQSLTKVHENDHTTLLNILLHSFKTFILLMFFLG